MESGFATERLVSTPNVYLIYQDCVFHVVWLYDMLVTQVSYIVNVELRRESCKAELEDNLLHAGNIPMQF